MSPIDLPKIYNPAIQTKQELIDNFVVRTELFKEIWEDIKTSEMRHPEQHYIIQGNRGQGKTTLLLRIAYEIENNPELSEGLIPVLFNEEQYNISRLFKLWESIAEYLKESGHMPSLYEQMQHLDYDNDYERRCFELLESSLIQNHKKIVVFIDNIDELFEKFSKQEHHRLREVFIESAELRVIGASSTLLEFHHDYGKPFYQFFKMPHLKGLNIDETQKLLLGLGVHYKKDRVREIVENQPGRIEALRRLTGGVIRTIIILFEIFVDDENGSAFKDLEKILDMVTPLYKHRMDKLSAQQQEIVDFIALNWEAVSVKDIARKTKMESKAVSAQLGKLEKYSIIEKEKTTTKNYLYRIQERFFNIWYLMRLGRKWDERRVRFVVEFLQIWCDDKDLEIRANWHLNALKQGKLIDRHALFMTEALIRTPIKSELKGQLIDSTRTYLEKSRSELCEFLSDDEKILTGCEVRDAQPPDVLEVISTIEKKTNKTPDELNLLGLFYIDAKKDVKKAQKIFLEAVEKGDSDAMYNLALLYETDLKDYDKAKEYYLMAVKKGDSGAMNNLAVLYQAELKDYDKAREYYLMAVEKGHSGAMFNLALLYKTELKDYDKAREYYLMAVKKGDSDAMNNLALLYKTELKD
ncbi:MAG: tetratricopeptide repeat protein [Desulfosalsimonadaceae bacterium]